MVLWLLASGPAAATLFSTDGKNLASELKSAERESRRLVVYFELPSCPGCRDMKEHVFSEPRTERNFGRQYRTVRVDLASAVAIIDTDGKRSTPKALAQRLRIVGTPAFAFFDPDGSLNYLHVGALPDPADFVSLGRFVAEAAYENQPFADYRQHTGGALNAEPSTLAHRQPGQLKPDFELRDHHGRLRRLADFRGKAIALMVGYTQCPDVCPTTLAELQMVVTALGAEAQRVQVLFATLDPDRDTQQMLGAYMASFHPNFLALRGNAAQTAAFIHRFALIAKKQPLASHGYTLDHTAGIFLFDHTGRLRGFSPYGQPLNLLSADLKTLTAETHRTASQLGKH